MPTTEQSIVVNAEIETVWEKLKNFHDLTWAPKVISEVKKVGDKHAEEIGAKRILNGVFEETLIEINPDTCLIRYSIDDGPSPVSKEEVSNYVGRIQLTPEVSGVGTLVQWTSSWDSSSEEAVAFCHGIYVALLNELAGYFD